MHLSGIETVDYLHTPGKFLVSVELFLARFLKILKYDHWPKLNMGFFVMVFNLPVKNPQLEIGKPFLKIQNNPEKKSQTNPNFLKFFLTL